MISRIINPQRFFAMTSKSSSAIKQIKSLPTRSLHIVPKTSSRSQFSFKSKLLVGGVLGLGLYKDVAYYPYVVSSHNIFETGKCSSDGRLGASIVSLNNFKFKGPNIFYYKKALTSNEHLLNDVIASSLAREIFDNDYPLILFSQCSGKNSLLSQCIAGSVPYSNVKNWVNQKNAIYFPKHLGEAVAFKMLIGEGDSSLENIVVILNKEGRCYSIDHEFAFEHTPKFISDDGETAFEFMRIQQNKILKEAVRNDIENGRITAFYEKFANLPDERVEKMLDRFPILSIKEREIYLDQIKSRQVAAREFLDKKASIQFKL